MESFPKLVVFRVPRAAALILLLAVVAGDSGVENEDEPSAASGAAFLQSVIRRMQEDKFIHSGEDLDGGYRPTPAPPHHQQYGTQEGGDFQTPPLSKAELQALYQAAVTKGSGLNFSALPALPISGDDHQNDELVSPSDQGTLPGYYYYFYPIKSFMPNGSSDLAASHMMNGSEHDMMMMMMGDNNMADDKETRLDPLFLAMAGFVSVATIVSFSILFLPKFGNDRSAHKAALKTLPEDDDMFSLTRVVGQAIQGEDCADRLACELGRAIRNMKLGQKPIRVLEAMLPPNLSRQMTQVRQHMVKKEKCQFIPCKRLKPAPPRNKQKPNNKKQPKT